MMIPKSQNDGYLWRGWGSDGRGAGVGLAPGVRQCFSSPPGWLCMCLQHAFVFVYVLQLEKKKESQKDLQIFINK